MLPVVSNYLTFTWEGSQVLASVLFRCLWNYPLSFGL